MPTELKEIKEIKDFIVMAWIKQCIPDDLVIPKGGSLTFKFEPTPPPLVLRRHLKRAVQKLHPGKKIVIE